MSFSDLVQMCHDLYPHCQCDTDWVITSKKTTTVQYIANINNSHRRNKYYYYYYNNNMDLWLRRSHKKDRMLKDTQVR